MEEDSKNVELAVARTLLNDGVPFTISAPLLLRLFGKKTITLKVRELKYGAMLYQSAIAVKHGLKKETFEEDFTHENFIAAAPAVFSYAAIAVLNGKLKIKLFAKPLARLLKWETPAKIWAICNVATGFSNISAFQSTTVLIATMRVTAKKTGPNEQGSQQS